MTADAHSTSCKTHGDLPWRGHVQCSSCGAAYTTKETSRIRLPTHAPARCRKCRARLMPVAGRRHVEYTAVECCAACFAEAKGYTFDDGHDRDDPACKGLECPFHGPMLRKLARRAASNGPIGPGVLGDVTLYPEAKS